MLCALFVVFVSEFSEGARRLCHHPAVAFSTKDGWQTCHYEFHWMDLDQKRICLIDISDWSTQTFIIEKKEWGKHIHWDDQKLGFRNSAHVERSFFNDGVFFTMVFSITSHSGLGLIP